MNQNVLFSPFPLDSSTDFIHRDNSLFLKKLRKRGQKDRCHRRWFPFWSPFLAMFTKTKRYHSCTAFNTVKNSYGGDRLKFIDLWYNAVRACQVSPLDCCKWQRCSYPFENPISLVITHQLSFTCLQQTFDLTSQQLLW